MADKKETPKPVPVAGKSKKELEGLQLEVLQRLEVLIDKQNQFLERLERYLRPKEIATVIEIKKFIKDKQTGQLTEVTKGGPMKLQVTENAQITVTGVKDAGGNPAQLDGELSWSVAGDQGLGDLQVAADKQSALFVRNGKVGVCKVQVSGDADLSPGERLIMAEVELECLAGEATVIELNAEAVPQA